MSEPVIPECAACRVAGSNAHCDACPRTPWQEYATSEDGVREYAKAEPVIPERPTKPYPVKYGKRNAIVSYPVMATLQYVERAEVFMKAAEAKVAEQADIIAELKNSLAHEELERDIARAAAWGIKGEKDEQAATIAMFESRVALLQKVFDGQAVTIERLIGIIRDVDDQVCFMPVVLANKVRDALSKQEPK